MTNYLEFNFDLVNRQRKRGYMAADKKRKSILLNWRLWLGLFMLALLIVSVISIAYDPRATGPGGDITKSSFFLGITFTVGASWLVLEIVYRFLRPAFPALWEKVQGLDRKTNANTDNIKDLGNAYKQLIDEYQQSKGETRGELNQLQSQVNSFVQENVELNRTIIKMERELAEVRRKLLEAEMRHDSDQREITLLRAQLEDMKLEFLKLNSSNELLNAENRELKTSLGRRATDKLNQLSPENEARLTHLEVGEMERLKEKRHE